MGKLFTHVSLVTGGDAVRLGS